MTTLWRTQFARFKVVTTAGSLHFREHSFSGEKGETWFLPHFATTLSFTNAGAVLGRILDVRAVARYPGLPIEDAFEVFPCIGEFDPKKYSEVGRGRLRMMDEARLGELTPFTVLPRTSETKFLIFSTRWDKPVRQQKLAVEIEIFTDRSEEWQKVEEWTFPNISPFFWHHVEAGGLFTTRSVNTAERSATQINPPDLHKYTLDAELDTTDVKDVGASHETTPALHRSNDDK